MCSSSWPTQNEPGGVFVGSFSHNALSGFFPLTGLFIYVMFPGFLGFLCVRTCMSLHLRVSYAFSLTTFFCLFISS